MPPTLTTKTTPADALELIAKHEGIWPSLVNATFKAQATGRTWTDPEEAVWSLLHSAGCDMDEGTRWDRLLRRMFPGA